MSKAEELAERAYPKREYVIYGPLPSEEPSVIDDNKPYRIGFVEGYHQAEKDLHKSIYKAGYLDGFEDAVEGQYDKGYEQAEKDLELTWEDIPEIFGISERLKTSWWFRDNEQTKQIGTQVFWEEVLKRFKDFKEKKEK